MSDSGVEKDLGIRHHTVKMVCEQKNYKIDGFSYIFEYVDKQDYLLFKLKLKIHDSNKH